MPLVGGLLGRLPAGVITIAALLVGASLMQAGNVTPAAIHGWLGVKVTLLVQTIIAIMPVTSALAGVLAAFYLITHHHEGGIRAAVSCAVQILLLIVWYAGAGIWVTAHLTGVA